MTARATTLVGSTIGKKAIMAITGIILIGFVLGHMIGNLQLFGGPEKLNAYAKLLRTSMPLLWTVRLVLLASVGLHILTAYQLWSANNAARPVSYRLRADRKTTYAARTMVWSGPILLFFILYHVAHLTLGYGPGTFDAHNVYGNVVQGFQVWYVSLFYIVAMLALGYHMNHGIWSLFQSMGWNHTKYNAARRRLATAITLVVVIGNISMPVAVLTGLVK